MCVRTRVRRRASRSTTNLQIELAALVEHQSLLHLKTSSSVALLHRVGLCASVASDRSRGSCSGNFAPTAGKFACHHPQRKLCAPSARRTIGERSPAGSGRPETVEYFMRNSRDGDHRSLRAIVMKSAQSDHTRPGSHRARIMMTAFRLIPRIALFAIVPGADISVWIRRLARPFRSKASTPRSNAQSPSSLPQNREMVCAAGARWHSRK